MKENLRTVDIKFFDLCDEIDYWKDRAKKAEENAEYWRGEYAVLIKQNQLDAKEGVRNALMFALAVKDDEHGNLIIDKEARKELAERYKSNHKLT